MACKLCERRWQKKLSLLVEKGLEAMSRLTDEIEDLVAEVGGLTTVVSSAAELLDKLAGMIESNIGDEDALREIAENLKAQKNVLADAVVRNTPEEPPVEPPMPEPPIPEPEPER